MMGWISAKGWVVLNETGNAILSQRTEGQSRKWKIWGKQTERGQRREWEMLRLGRPTEVYISPLSPGVQKEGISWLQSNLHLSWGKVSVTLKHRHLADVLPIWTKRCSGAPGGRSGVCAQPFCFGCVCLVSLGCELIHVDEWRRTFNLGSDVFHEFLSI